LIINYQSVKHISTISVDNSINGIIFIQQLGIIKPNITRLMEVKTMKIVTLCKEGSCCPAVKITDSQVEIGENDNTCVLTMKEWEILKEKILGKEL